MPINTPAVINVCQQLAEQENLAVTVKEVGKGALVTGMCAFVGGLLAGPLGLGIGGVIGSVTAAYNSKGKYKSVVEVLNEMTPHEKTKLAIAVTNAIKDVGVEDIAYLSAIILNKGPAQQLVLNAFNEFFKHEMGYSLLN